MGKLEILTKSPEGRARRYRRFPLRYSIRVRFTSQDALSELEGISRNISMGGLLVETSIPIPQNCLVTFTMTLEGANLTRAVELAGEGRVVRVETGDSGIGFAIAVQCERPLIELSEVS